MLVLKDSKTFIIHNKMNNMIKAQQFFKKRLN